MDRNPLSTTRLPVLALDGRDRQAPLFADRCASATKETDVDSRARPGGTGGEWLTIWPHIVPFSVLGYSGSTTPVVSLPKNS
jgi:hypothetical protein